MLTPEIFNSYYDLHTHTVFSDGADTPRRMVLAAISKGLAHIGISDHSYTFFDESYCMKKETVRSYKDTINFLKDEFAAEITVSCGIEQDMWSEEPTDEYDYIIGSVHYLKIEDAYIPVDEGADVLRSAADVFFDGDIYALAGEYFEEVSTVAEKTNCDIIGHFDLITKFNENGKLFDTSDPRYVSAWRSAADKLLKYCIPFEINTGAISRGYRSAPYPSGEIAGYLKEHGGKLILSSDAHKAADIAFGFDKFNLI